MTITDRLADEVRATSDHVLILAAELAGAEELKRSVDPEDETFLALSIQVRDLARQLASIAAYEETLAVRIAGRPGQPIDHVPPHGELARIVDDWRATREQIRITAPGTTEAKELHRAAARLRDAYTESISRRFG